MAPRLPSRPFLYPILDLELLGSRSLGQAVATLAAAGAGVLQVRAKLETDARYLALAREAVRAARAAGVVLLVNDRPDVARILEADGVHLGQDDLPPADARRLLGPAALIGLSTHSLAQLEAATAAPVDYVAIGPVFPTRTKQHADPVVGLELVRRARELVRGPLVAIGGITRANARAVIDAGADGVAVISDLLQAPDLGQAAAELLRALEGAAWVTGH